MKTLHEIISEPKFEVKGNGKITFSSGIEGNANFTIRMLNNGITEGELELDPPDLKFTVPLSKNENFVLEGKTEDGSNIIGPECHVINSNQKFGEKTSIKVNFYAEKVIIDQEILKTKPQKELVVKCSIVNVHETLRITVDTELGELTLINYQGIKDLEKIIRSHKISLITSELQIIPKIDDSYTLQDIKEKSLKIARNFLKLTSLAQTVWHSIAMFTIYEKTDDSDNYHRIYLELFYPKTKSPISLGLANTASFPHFLKSAWKGYSENIDENYGFTLALEWYLDSWSASVLESQYLSATTCLEMLMDKFHSKEKSEYILPDEKFAEFQGRVKDCVKQKGESLGLDPHTRALFYNKLGKGLNRRSFVDKAQMLIDYWGIKYDDLKITLNDVVRIRNDITHRGQHAGDTESEEIFSVYKGLIVIIIRILLAMVNFDWEYWDFARQESVKFDTVCIKKSND